MERATQRVKVALRLLGCPGARRLHLFDFFPVRILLSWFLAKNDRGRGFLRSGSWWKLETVSPTTGQFADDKNSSTKYMSWMNIQNTCHENTNTFHDNWNKFHENGNMKFETVTWSHDKPVQWWRCASKNSPESEQNTFHEKENILWECKIWNKKLLLCLITVQFVDGGANPHT